MVHCHMTNVRRKVLIALIVGALAVAAIAVVPTLAGCRASNSNTSNDSEATAKTKSPSENPSYWTEERMRNAQPAPMPNPWC